MKVLLFSGDYWPDPGGIAAHVYYISRALADAGAHVTVIGGHRAPILHPSDKPSGEGTFREITIQRTGPPFLRGVMFLLRAWNALRRLSREDWDVIHFHNFVPDGLLLGLFRWPSASCRVMTNHSDLLLKTLDRGRSSFLFRQVVRSADGIIGPSPELCDRSAAIRHPGQVVTYIPNGVDLRRFTPGSPSRESYRLLCASPEQKIILAVRRHDPKCGLAYLLQAVPSIASRHPEAVFCLIGDGEQTRQLKQMAAELNLGEAVRFLGRMSHDVLPLAWRAAYVSVLPSAYEAVSLSGLESLACGVPVVGTNVGGIPEFVKSGHTGLLVEPFSSEALAEGLNYMLDHPGERERMAVESRALVSRSFSWAAVAARTLAFYRTLESR